MQPLLITLFQPHMYGNGLDRFTINLAKTFNELNINVDLVVPEITDYHKEISKDLPAGINSISLDLPVSSDIAFKKILKLKTYLEQRKPDLFLANADYVGVSNAAKLLSHTPSKIFHVVHINVSQYFERFPGFKAKVRPLLLKQCYENAAGIIAVSEGVAQNLIHQFKLSSDKVQVIYNPVVTPDLMIQAKKPVEHPWFAPGEPPVILGAGRLMPQKDYPTLIKAFAKVRQQRPCRLMILGEWSAHKEDLEQLTCELGVGAEVQFPGFTYNPYSYMSQASVFALSSRFEGLPSVLIEAMAIGTPVVSTDCESGPREILDHGKYGSLVPVGDADALAQAIQQTLNHPIDRGVLQLRAQHFSSGRIAKQYLQLFQTPPETWYGIRKRFA
jgi:glycosyltransferase involved in cell wall biosynthesis